MQLTAFLYEDVKNTEAFREDLLQSRIPELGEDRWSQIQVEQG